MEDEDQKDACAVCGKEAVLYGVPFPFSAPASFGACTECCEREAMPLWVIHGWIEWVGGLDKMPHYRHLLTSWSMPRPGDGIVTEGRRCA
jgi:hypothetical protein